MEAQEKIYGGAKRNSQYDVLYYARRKCPFIE